jgi:CRP/FNR family transcriptional regulator
MDIETAANTSSQAMPNSETIEELMALGFSKEMLDALEPAVTATQLVHYASGDTIYHEATNIDALYVISKGRVKLLNNMENGRTRIIRLHNRGSIIGLNGLMEEAHTHTAVANDDVSIYQIPIHLINSIKHKEPDIYSRLLEHWHEYLHMADTWITDFSTGAIHGRVARLVRFLVETDDATRPSYVNLLTVEEMAEILGVTPESVSRSMADLKRKKILEVVDDTLHQYHCNIKDLLLEAEK